MCGRYALSYDSDELPQAFGQWGIDVNIAYGRPHPDNDDSTSESASEHSKESSNGTEATSETEEFKVPVYHKSFNIAPTNIAPVYYFKKGEVRYMRWGLVPFWAKDISKFKGYSTFNARLENLLSSRIWERSCCKKRCVVPISGYYEWLKEKTKSGKTKKDTAKLGKLPYYLRRKDNDITFLAGLYDYHKKENLYTFTIITGPAPKELEWLHERMPCVIEPDSEAWKSWTNPEKTGWKQKELDELLKPFFNDSTYRVYQVNKDVGKVANKGEYLTKPILKKDSNEIKREEGIKEEREESNNNTDNESIKQEDVKSNIKKEEKLEDTETNPPASKKRSITDMLRKSHRKKPKTEDT